MSSQFGFIDIILLAMFAAFIILRLRNILGRKTGYEGKSKNRNGYFPKGMEVLQDIEKNEAIRSGNIDEDVKKNFLKGANIAYEQIITNFAKGNKKSLKNLLSKNLFADFSNVIDERKKNQLTYETTFIGIKSSKVLEFKKIENIYKVTVQFVSEIITCTKDKNNKIIEGNPEIIKSANDVWKFSKNMWSQDPTWYLVETTKK
ncbi:MAG: putative lipid-binding transport protein, Tim44 family [Pelagibacterales bacterium]|jgi:predicted lipid-binding transport protein (Tim44 family)|nr:putative lipid-binding transport protein, Tim44 family [Pelagibacterales bacterium]